MRKIADLIRSAPRTAESERADWQGETAQARFQGAAQFDRAPHPVAFGKKAAR